ncbi:MAG: precorrin-6A reductase [Synergistaceae bacterium]
MRQQLLVFGGTTEAREILESGIPMFYSAATEYGTQITGEKTNTENLTGRMNEEEITNFLLHNEIKCVIDATHPYAIEVSKNIKNACTQTKTPLIRIARPSTQITKETIVVENCKEAIKHLNTTNKKILLTVGSKELHQFTDVENYKNRIYPRVLPTSAVIKECENLGFDIGKIIAMQGPFTEEMNTALLKQTGATILVTKDGGKAGGTKEKLDAANKNNTEIIIIKRPQEDGYSIEEALSLVREILKFPKLPLFPIYTKIQNKNVLIVGGGTIASRRAKTLLACGANVTIIAPEIKGTFDKKINIIIKNYEPSDINNTSIVVAATNKREINKSVGEEARNRNIPVSVADNANESTFFFPSLITEKNISVSVSSAGTSPKLTRKISDKIRENLPLWMTNINNDTENNEVQK